MISNSKTQKYTIHISLAGIPIRVCCEYEENKSFFNEYQTEEAPLFEVHADKNDYDAMQATIDRTDINEGRPPFRRPDYFLENNLLHAQIAENLIDYNVLLMHGSALCMDEKAYLFTAKSGTGKSTHAKLWREAFGDKVRMINDDKPLLKIGDNQVTVYGTPWNGKHRLGSNTSAELKAIIWLNRGEANHIEPMAKAEVFPVVFSQIYRSPDPQKMQKILVLEKQLMDNAEYYKLSCNMNIDAARTAYNGMNSERTLS